MTDEKYLQNQKNFIKREGKIILRNHILISSVCLFFLALFVFMIVGYQHPDSWQEVTVTLGDYRTVHAGRSGTRLDIYDTNGNRYAFNRNEKDIKEQLVIGRQYTFTYSDNFFHDIVEVMEIDNVVYLDYDDAIKNYQGMMTLFGVFIAIFTVGMVALNIFAYRFGTSDRVKRIFKYKKRIYDKEHKLK